MRSGELFFTKTIGMVSPDCLMGALYLKPLDDSMEKTGLFYARFMDDCVPRRRVEGQSPSLQLCCIKDEGLAPRSRHTGGGFKPL